MNTKMTLMNVDATMLEKKVDKLEKLQAIALEKEQFHLTQINILKRKIQKLQQEFESSKMNKIV